VAGMLRRLSGKPAHARLYARWCNADNRWQEMDLDALGRALRHIDVDADTDPASHTLRENMTNRMVELLSPRHQLRDHRNLALITSFHHHFSQQQTTQLTNVLLSEVRQVLSEPAFTFSFEYTTACEAAFEKLGVSKDVLASLNLRAEYIWRRSDTFPPRVALRE